MRRLLSGLLVFILLLQTEVWSQDISIFQQYNGRYDYLAIGNTLNPACTKPEMTFRDDIIDITCSLDWPPNKTATVSLAFTMISLNFDR